MVDEHIDIINSEYPLRLIELEAIKEAASDFLVLYDELSTQPLYGEIVLALKNLKGLVNKECQN